MSDQNQDQKTRLQTQIDDLQKINANLDKEMKSKQTVLRLFTDKTGSGQMVGMDSIKKELDVRDGQIAKLEDRLLVLDHEVKQHKSQVEKLTQIEQQYLKQQTSLQDLKKQCMRQEESIAGWLEDNQKKTLALQDMKAKWLQAVEENTRLVGVQNKHMSQVLELEKRLQSVKDLEDSVKSKSEQVAKLENLYNDSVSIRETQKSKLLHLQEELDGWTVAQVKRDSDHRTEVEGMEKLMKEVAVKHSVEIEAARWDKLELIDKHSEVVSKLQEQIATLKLTLKEQDQKQSESLQQAQRRHTEQTKVYEQATQDLKTTFQNQFAEQQKQLQTTMLQKDQTIGTLEEQLATWQTKHSDASKTLQSATDRVDQLTTYLKNNLPASTSLNADTKSLDLNMKLTHLHTNLEAHFTDHKSQTDKFRSLMGDKKKLEDLLSQAQSDLYKVQADQLERGTKHERDLKLTKDLHRSSEAALQELRQQYEVMMDQNGLAGKELEKVKKELGDLLTQSQADVQKLQADKLEAGSKHERDLKLSKDLHRSSESSLQELRLQYEQLLSENGQAGKELEKVKKEVHVLETNLENTRVLYKESEMNMKSSLEKAQRELKQAQQDLAKMEQSLSKQLSDLKQDFVTTEEAHIKQLADLRKSLQEELATTKQSLQAQVTSVSKELQAKSQELASCQSTLDSTNQILVRLNSKLDQQVAQIQSQTSVIQQLQDLTKDFDQLKQQNTDLQAKLAASLKKAAEAKQLQEVLKQKTALENEIEVLKEMVRGSQTQIKSKDVDIQRLQIKIKRLDKELEMMNQANQQSQAQLQREASPKHSSALQDISSGRNLRRQQDSRQSLHPGGGMLPPIAKPAASSIVDVQSQHKQSKQSLIPQKAPQTQSAYSPSHQKPYSQQERKSSQVTASQRAKILQSQASVQTLDPNSQHESGRGSALLNLRDSGKESMMRSHSDRFQGFDQQ